jgi:two-component system response regulator YesN
MMALLVDDEKHVRVAVRLLVDWRGYGVDMILEAPNGQAAIELINLEKPEIIVTDMMMPQMNGVELLEWIHTHAPASKTIVISGHDDFALLRHTVKYGGMDYILKPIDADQLNDAVNKAIETWRKEELERTTSRERNIEMNQLRPVYWDKQLTKLISDPAYYEAIADQLHREIGLERNVASCRIAILSMDTMERRLKDKFASNMDLLFFSLINICNEFLREQQSGISFRNWNNDNEIVLLLWKDLPKAISLLKGINEGLLLTLHSRMDFGIGEEHPFPTGITVSYKEARQSLRQRNLVHKDEWIHSRAEQDNAPKKALQLCNFEERIRHAIRSGSSEQIHAAVQLWIDAAKQLDKVTIEQLDHWWSEYNVLKRRWVQEFVPHNEDDTSGNKLSLEPTNLIIPLDENGILSFSLWQQELVRSMLHLSKVLLMHQQKDNNVIFEIAKYIENHYHQDLTLQEIANQFYLSREYISRKFKQEFRVNLSDYLGQIRIDKAKMLLLNPHLRITQISDMVGYKDEKYFSKVFKKLAGISPNEFRKRP